MSDIHGARFDQDLQRIAEQEQKLVLPDFDEEFAWKLGTWLRVEALAHRYPVAIDVRRFGQRLFAVSLPGAVPDNLAWVEKKSRTVEHFHRSSYAIGLELKRSASTLNQRYALPEDRYAAHGGAFPLRLTRGGMIGSVCVSGLPQRDDHNLVVEGLCHVLGVDPNSLRLVD